MDYAVLFVGLLAAASLHRANAHAGHLHDYPDTPSAKDFARVKVASCNRWVKPGAIVVRSTQATTQPQPAPITIAGNAIVWTYLYKNCSGVISSGIELNITAEEGNKPVNGTQLTGTTMTGTCASPGNEYLFNASAPANEGTNRLFWEHKATAENGTINGNAGNRGAVSTGTGGAKSIIVWASNDTAADAFACCDLVLAGPANTSWATPLETLGHACDAKYNKLNATEPVEPPAPATAPPKPASGASAQSVWALGMAGACALALVLV